MQAHKRSIIAICSLWLLRNQPTLHPTISSPKICINEKLKRKESTILHLCCKQNRWQIDTSLGILSLSHHRMGYHVNHHRPRKKTKTLICCLSLIHKSYQRLWNETCREIHTHTHTELSHRELCPKRNQPTKTKQNPRAIESQKAHLQPKIKSLPCLTGRWCSDFFLSFHPTNKTTPPQNYFLCPAMQ